MSASTCSALRRGRHSSRPKSLAQSERYTGTSPERVSGTGAIGTSLPVSRRQISVVSSSERLHSRPPPTFTVRPSQAAGSSSCRSTRSTRSSTWSRSRTCLPCSPEPDVAERVAEVVGEHPVGEDALVDLAHLPGAGDHPAAVGDGREAEGRPGTPRSAARRRAWSSRRGCGRRSSGKSSEIPAGETPGTACSAAISKRVSPSSRFSSTCGATG